MADDANTGNAKGGRYAAFISYSHRDDEIGEWLHKRLESYRVPSPLVGREGPGGAIGKRLGKVFRDRADLSAAHDLGAEINAALEKADALIVLCSPRSCGSKYVEAEIRRFKQLGKGDRIFAAIVDGEPHAAGKPGRTAADECFPPALIYRLAPDGSVSSQPEPTEPIAADFREDKDGRENGSLKLIAGLLGVPLDELVQREKQAERRRRLQAYAISAAMAVLALGAVAAGGVAWWQQQVAQRNEARAVQGEALAERNATLAEQRAAAEARERERANHNAEQAELQALAARRSEAGMRTALARVMAERSWQALEQQNVHRALRYALAGWREAPENESEYAAVVGRTLHRSWREFPDYVFFYEGRATVWHEVGFPWSAAFSLDGTRIVTAHSALNFVAGIGPAYARVIEFDPLLEQTGVVQTYETVVAVLRGHEFHVRSAAFSPDGARIVTASFDGTARVWETTTGREIALLRGHEGQVWSAAFSPDGLLVVTAGDRTARVWDVASAREIATLRGHRGEVVSAAFSADGSHIVTASSDHTARLWDARGREIAVLSGHADEVTSAAFSPDGARIVTASRDRTARVWDAVSGREIVLLLGHASRVASAAFSPDGMRIVTAAGDGVRVWDAVGGRMMDELYGHSSEVHSAAFSPDGRWVVTASRDRTVRWWRVQWLTQPMAALARAACSTLLSGSDERRFSAEEIRADPLISEVWLRDGAPDSRDVCEGVPGVAPLPRAAR